jgi:hypothetical protein
MGFVQNSSGRLDGWGLCKTQVGDLTDGVCAKLKWKT